MEKEHNCEEYRFTDMKYNKIGEMELDYNNPILVSWCSLCGKLLRKVVLSASHSDIVGKK